MTGASHPRQRRRDFRIRASPGRNLPTCVLRGWSVRPRLVVNGWAERLKNGGYLDARLTAITSTTSCSSTTTAATGPATDTAVVVFGAAAGGMATVVTTAA